ncbi:TetR/AcrR family transcriptional regulator [Sporosarcina sp. CAU 1771]
MRKKEIKEVALRMFAMKGYEETSLSMIANEVGIKTPSIYAFYKNKESIFLTALHDVLHDHFEHIKNSADSLSDVGAEEKLFKILQEMYAYHLREKEKTTFFLRFMLFSPEGLKDQIHEEFIKSDKFLEGILREIFIDAMDKDEIKSDSIDSLVSSFLCLMDGLFIQLFYYQSNIDELELRLKTNWKIYWNSIRNQYATT